MKQASDDLHRIIGGMNPDEKRLFKQYISEDKKQTQAIVLFDILNRMETFDAAQYDAHIKRKKMEHNAPSVKSQLKEKLVYWLSGQMNGPSNTGWFKQIGRGEVFLRFKLFEEARDCFEVLRQQACQQGYGVYELIALTYLSTIYQSVQTEDMMESYVQLSNRVAELTHKLYSSAAAQNYYMRTIALFYETRSMNRDVHRKLVQQLRREHLFDATDSFLRMEESIYVFSARMHINLMLGQLKKAYLENDKLYQSVTQFEKRIHSYQPNEFAVVMREKLYYCMLTGKEEEYRRLYFNLYRKALSSTKNKSGYVLRIEMVNLLYLIKTRQHDLLKREVTRLDEYETTSDYDLETVANKKEAHMYAGYTFMELAQWNIAIQKFNQLIAMKALDVTADFDHTARFMILLCQFADIISNSQISMEEPSPFLSHQADAFYEYIVKKRLDAPIEKQFIKTLKDFSKGGIKKNQRDKLNRLVNNLQAGFENLPPYYVVQLAEFNWINHVSRWLEKFVR